MRTKDELKEAVEKTELEFLPIRICSICGYTIGFRFIDGMAYFDPNCKCGNYIIDLEIRSWKDVANFVNSLAHSHDERQKILSYFGFEVGIA